MALTYGRRRVRVGTVVSSIRLPLPFADGESFSFYNSPARCINGARVWQPSAGQGYILLPRDSSVPRPLRFINWLLRLSPPFIRRLSRNPISPIYGSVFRLFSPSFPPIETEIAFLFPECFFQLCVLLLFFYLVTLLHLSRFQSSKFLCSYCPI